MEKGERKIAAGEVIRQLTRNLQNTNAGTFPQEQFPQLMAGETGHLHVGDQQIDGAAEGPGQFNGFLSISGYEDREVGSSKRKQEQIANDDVVIGKEDDAIPFCDAVVKDLLVVLFHCGTQMV